MHIILIMGLYLFIGFVFTTAVYKYIGCVEDDDMIVPLILMWPFVLLIALAILINELVTKLVKNIIEPKDKNAVQDNEE